VPESEQCRPVAGTQTGPVRYLIVFVCVLFVFLYSVSLVVLGGGLVV